MHVAVLTHEVVSSQKHVRVVPAANAFQLVLKTLDAGSVSHRKRRAEKDRRFELSGTVHHVDQSLHPGPSFPILESEVHTRRRISKISLDVLARK